MAHLIYVLAKDTKKFNYVKFGTYKLRNGKTSVLLNPDDVSIDGWEMFDAHVTLDIENEYDNRIYEFLKEHPFIRQDKHFRLVDTKARVQKQAEQILSDQTSDFIEEHDVKDCLMKLQEQITTAEETILQFEINMEEMAKHYEKR